MIFTLFRGILILLIAVTLTAFFSFIDKIPGSIIFEIQKKEIKFSLLIFLLLLLIFGFLFFFSIKVFQFFLALIDFFMGKETALLRFFKKIKYRKSQTALNNAIIALVEGENQKVLSEANKALLNPDFNKAISLIKARAEENLGNYKKADNLFKKLLLFKETRLAALDGLIRSKISSGDLVTALKLAERLITIKPKSNQYLNTLFKIQCELKDWIGARKTLVLQQNLDKKTRSIKQRQEALIIYAEALKIKSEGNEEKALYLIKDSLKKSPDLVPAACFASELEKSIGKIKIAEKYIKSCWKIKPHPDLARSFNNIYPDELPKDRLKRFSPLFNNFSDNKIVKSIKIELLIANNEFKYANELIEPLINDEPNSNIFMLKAAIEKGIGSDDNIVQSWISKAYFAPRPPVWFCEKCNHIDSWAPFCQKCKSFDSMTWGNPFISNLISESNSLLPFKIENQNDNLENKKDNKGVSEVIEEDSINNRIS